MFFKNATTTQGVYLFARNTSTTAGQESDASNITAYVSKGGQSPVESTNSVSEVDGGLYWLELTQAETNANMLAVVAESVTSNVVIDPVIIATTAGAIPMSTFGSAGGISSYDQVDSMDTSIGLVSSAVGDVQSDVTSIMGAAFVEGTHALDQQASIGELADGVLDEALSGHTTTGTAGAALQGDYWVQLDFNGGVTQDAYEGLRWFKNGVPLDSGITDPTIQVITSSTGVDLIAETAMSEAGSSHLFRYVAGGSELTTPDVSYTARFTATIDGSTQIFEKKFRGSE